METPLQRWLRVQDELEEIILYCDGYIANDRKVMRTEMEINTIRQLHGEPTPELRERAKRQLREEYLRYWRTI